MPTPEDIETLDGTSARRMLARLTALIATLYALIDELRETIAHDVNPQDYIADVLMRIQDHPQSAIDELMPYRWTPRD